jgi:glycosyltransferase involved in cell wall biosynthesis
MDKITTCISTNNNINYLKLAIKSVRQNAYYKDMPIIVHAENCNDGTDSWLEENKDKYDLKIYIDHNNHPKGIGGGMNFCVDKAQTEFVNIIHSDMWVAPNQDLELLKIVERYDEKERVIASSYRIQPDIFNDQPRPGTIFHNLETFGIYYHDFKSDYFDEWANEFSKLNNIEVRKGGGAGFFCRKRDYVYIGGNDPRFSPASWDDMDIFSRMQMEKYHFVMTTKSCQWHFAARGSHFKDDDLHKKSERQIKAEQDNVRKWIDKWGRMPDYDSHTFVIPIKDTGVNPIMDFQENLNYFQ